MPLRSRLVHPTRRLVQRLGAAGPRLAVVPRCGHLSHEEAPAALLSFLQSFVLELGLHG